MTLEAAAAQAGGQVLGSAISGYFANKANSKNVRAQVFMGQEARRQSSRDYWRNASHTLGTAGVSAAFGPDGIGADNLGRYRDLRDSRQGLRQSFDILGDEYGMTPQEIAGSPVPGGTSQSGGGATLGNQVGQQQAVRAQVEEASRDRALTASIESERNKTAILGKMIDAGIAGGSQMIAARGQDVQMSVAELNNATQEAVSKLASETQIFTSTQATEAQKYAADMAAAASNMMSQVMRANALGDQAIRGAEVQAKIVEIGARAALLKTDNQIQEILRENFMSLKVAGMGPDNVIVQALLMSEGIPAEALLTGNLTSEQKATVDGVIRRINALNSTAFRNLSGITEAAANVPDAAGSLWDRIVGP